MQTNSLEDICDKLAEKIDAANGHIDVDDLIKATGIERDLLLKKFNELYLCDPYVYVQNAIEDLKWDSSNGSHHLEDR